MASVTADIHKTLTDCRKSKALPTSGSEKFLFIDEVNKKVFPMRPGDSSLLSAHLSDGIESVPYNSE